MRTTLIRASTSRTTLTSFTWTSAYMRTVAGNVAVEAHPAIEKRSPWPSTTASIPVPAWLMRAPHEA